MRGGCLRPGEGLKSVGRLVPAGRWGPGGIGSGRIRGSPEGRGDFADEFLDESGDIGESVGGEGELAQLGLFQDLLDSRDAVGGWSRDHKVLDDSVADVDGMFCVSAFMLVVVVASGEFLEVLDQLF